MRTQKHTIQPVDEAAGALIARAVTLAGHGGVPILQDIHLDVQPGERLAIIGPNGAGKTTLLHILSGRTQAHAGEVTYAGRPLGSIGLAARARRTAFVAQHEQPDPRLSVVEYVGLGRIPHRASSAAARDRDAVQTAMQRLALSRMADRRLATLSGGERQRATIARAVAQAPTLLFLDEPTNHLDLLGRSEILDLVAGLGIAVVAVLHDLTLVAPFADRVAVLDGGRLVCHDRVAVALTPARVREVFKLAYLQLSDPATGRIHHVFDLAGRQT